MLTQTRQTPSHATPNTQNSTVTNQPTVMPRLGETLYAPRTTVGDDGAVCVTTKIGHNLIEPCCTNNSMKLMLKEFYVLKQYSQHGVESTWIMQQTHTQGNPNASMKHQRIREDEYLYLKNPSNQHHVFPELYFN